MSHVIRKMTAGEGDVILAEWEVEDKTSVEAAKAIFEQIMKNSYALFAIDGMGGGVQVREFDPAIKELVAVPQIVGG